MNLYDIAGTALRRLPAESAHQLTILALRAGLGPVQHAPDDPVLRTRIGPLDLANPIGLAAGFDKNARTGAAMMRAGFGWVECGTVTPLPQAGNPRPRLFRLTRDGAVINRMGFNNDGLDIFARNLAAQRKRGWAIGANIGANKTSKDRIGDYVTGLKTLWGLPAWFTINISSPNTPGLRELQSKDALQELLGRIMEGRAALTGDQPSPPFFLKVSPDLDDTQIIQISETACHYALDGLIISNTTISRPDDLQSAARGEGGGLSGKPLFTRSTEVLRAFRHATRGRMTLIGVGGIASGADAYAKIRAGANAVQLYTALALHGPSLVGTIKSDLAERLRANGFSSVDEAVGRD
ncbi:MAG: dihydroorotate dehydrogenase (quinone) [Robiginitomaculum sp.]|nr:MAG: dihydroorotate dehydrogenase (quinone) [Robiginitomaculum sp.]